MSVTGNVLFLQKPNSINTKEEKQFSRALRHSITRKFPTIVTPSNFARKVIQCIQASILNHILTKLPDESAVCKNLNCIGLMLFLSALTLGLRDVETH